MTSVLLGFVPRSPRVFEPVPPCRPKFSSFVTNWLFSKRNAPRRLRLKRSDRVLWVLLSRFWSGWRRCLQMVQPATVIAWHRRAFALYWTWKSRRLPGRPKTTAEIRDLIRRMSHANPLWGAPRVHGELLKLGIEVAQSTVAKYLRRHRKPPMQT